MLRSDERMRVSGDRRAPRAVASLTCADFKAPPTRILGDFSFLNLYNQIQNAPPKLGSHCELHLNASRTFKFRLVRRWTTRHRSQPPILRHWIFPTDPYLFICGWTPGPPRALFPWSRECIPRGIQPSTRGPGVKPRWLFLLNSRAPSSPVGL